NASGQQLEERCAEKGPASARGNGGSRSYPLPGGRRVRPGPSPDFGRVLPVRQSHRSHPVVAVGELVLLLLLGYFSLTPFWAGSQAREGAGASKPATDPRLLVAPQHAAEGKPPV